MQRMTSLVELLLEALTLLTRSLVLVAHSLETSSYHAVIDYLASCHAVVGSEFVGCIGVCHAVVCGDFVECIGKCHAITCWMR